MDKTERIARLLAKGLKPSIVATMVGCSPSYLSNLTADPDFRLAVEEIRVATSEETSTRASETEVLKDRLLALEHQVVSKLEDRLEFMPERELIALFDRIGNRRDKLEPVTAVIESATLGADGQPTKLVRISVPTICAPDLTIGSNNEIIAIGSRSVNPMPTEALRKLLDADTEPEAEALEAEYESYQTS